MKLVVELRLQKKPHKSVVRNTELLKLIHSDLCEFEGILTRGGNRYIITFIDDFSKYTTIYWLKNKSDSFEKFQGFLKEVENQFSRKIKRIKSDRGCEYESSAFNSFVQSNKASTSSVYMFSSINFWHAHLCHINSRYVEIMNSLGLISRLSKDFEKCETCSRAKITKKTS